MKNQTAIYLRLSREDGDEMESNSIANQRELIKAYAKTNGLNIYGEYVDDGISGATFDRPSFKKMISDMEAGKFNSIIVKDLSRFGRDYIESGNYLQKFFPERGIRFISINDNYDSLTADTNDTHLILPIRNFINDSYCRDISVKVKSSQKTKRQRGEFIGAFAVFGYVKSKKDKHKLVVDEKVRHIIEKIFHMKVEGYSSSAIAKHLNETGEVTPAARREMRGEKYNGFTSVSRKWDTCMVNRILSNRVYTGVLEQGKHTKLNYKSHVIVKVDEDLWYVKKDAHPAIVSESIFNIANEMQKRDLSGRAKTPSLLSGLLFCKDCGSQMIRRKTKYKDKETIFYICGEYNDSGKCTRHSVKETEIVEVLDGIINEYLRVKSSLYEKLSDANVDEMNLEGEFEELYRQIRKYEMMRKSLLSDLEDDLITEDEFRRYRSEYASKISEIEAQIERKKEICKEIRDKIKSGEWLCEMSPYKKGSRLDRHAIVYLINRIEVKEDGRLSVVFYDDDKIDILSELVRKAENAQLSTAGRGMASEDSCVIKIPSADTEGASERKVACNG